MTFFLKHTIFRQRWLIAVRTYIIRLVQIIAIIGCWCAPLHSAQMINNIPTDLSYNWQVCLHFEFKSAECSEITLPEKSASLPFNVQRQTYTKDFIPSSELRNSPLGIAMEFIDDVDKVYINGELIGKTGKFPPNFESGFRQQRLYLIPNELLEYNRFNRIEIQTFSSHNQPGIQTHAPILGNFLEMQNQAQQHDYIYLVVATIQLILLIFPVFYFVVVKGNYETVYFMFFLFAFSIVALARSQLSINFGLVLSTAFKLEAFMLVVGIVAFTLFVFSYFELELRRIYSVCIYLLGFSALVLIVWPYSLYLRHVAEINYWLLIVVCFYVVGSALIIAIHKQRKYSIAFTVVCSVGWLVLIYDVVMQSSNLFRLNLTIYPALMPIVSSIFSIIFTLILTHKYWHFFKGSTYDHLTGTLLRPAFFQRISEEMQRCRRSETHLLVAIIEIQQAKKIAANYGYSIGNHLLTAVSQALNKTLRPYDLICRFSDDQFCIAASITNIDSAEDCIQRIYNELINIQQPINKEIELYVDARIGSTVYDEELHLSVSHIIQDANYALAKAKSQTKQSYLLLQNNLSNN